MCLNSSRAPVSLDQARAVEPVDVLAGPHGALPVARSAQHHRPLAPALEVVRRPQDDAALVAVRVQVRRHAHLEVRASQPRGVRAGARVRLVGGAGGFAGRVAGDGHGGGQRGGDGREGDQAGGGQGRERVARAIAQERRHRVAAVVEDPAQVAAHERHVRERPERSVRDRVAHAVDEQRAAVDGLEECACAPRCGTGREPGSRRTGAAAPRCRSPWSTGPGSGAAPASTRRRAPADSCSGRGSRIRKRSHGGVICSRLSASP